MMPDMSFIVHLRADGYFPFSPAATMIRAIFAMPQFLLFHYFTMRHAPAPPPARRPVCAARTRVKSENGARRGSVVEPRSSAGDLIH